MSPTTAPPTTDPALTARISLKRVRKATRLAVIARSGGITARQLADREDLRDAVLGFAPRHGSMYRHVAPADLDALLWTSASTETWRQAVVILRTLEELG